MAAPSKVWIVLPVVITAAPIPIVQYTDEVEANKAAVRASIGGNVQHYVMEAVSYADPEITLSVIDAALHPIV